MRKTNTSDPRRYVCVLMLNRTSVRNADDSMERVLREYGGQRERAGEYRIADGEQYIWLVIDERRQTNELAIGVWVEGPPTTRAYALVDALKSVGAIDNSCGFITGKV